MKRIKSILLILPLIFILSGCDLNYKVVINEDLTTNEELNLKISKAELDEFKEKNDEAYLNETLQEYINYFEKNDYVISFEKNNLNKFNANRKNKSLILNEKIMKSRYDYYDLSCNNEVCLLYATADNNIISGDGSSYDLTFTIQVPYKVLENNADKVDLIKHEYTWYSKTTNDNNDIKLVFLKEGNNIPKINRVLYFITMGIFAIIGLGILIILIKFISKIIKSGRP